MNNKKLQLLLKSFDSHRDYIAFRKKVVFECGITSQTLWNYTRADEENQTPLPKLVAEKITEIILRDYPDKAGIVNQLQES